MGVEIVSILTFARCSALFLASLKLSSLTSCQRGTSKGFYLPNVEVKCQSFDARRHVCRVKDGHTASDRWSRDHLSDQNVLRAAAGPPWVTLKVTNVAVIEVFSFFCASPFFCHFTFGWCLVITLPLCFLVLAEICMSRGRGRVKKTTTGKQSKNKNKNSA